MMTATRPSGHADVLIARYTLDLRLTSASGPARVEDCARRLDDPAVVARIERAVEAALAREAETAGVCVTVRD